MLYVKKILWRRILRLSTLFLYMTIADELLFPDFGHEGYIFSCDKKKIQPEVVYQFLDEESYWSKGVPFDTVLQAIRHSDCIGIYTAGGRQVGFGRMITDRATFGYLADIFVLKEHRGKGLSKEMMRAFCSLADAFGLRRFLLTTQDAHGLYRQSGFEIFSYPERLMSRPGIVYQSPSSL